MKFPPKTINGWYGYRTARSMKSQERWEFAQIYSARELVKHGLFLILFGGIGLFWEPVLQTAQILSAAAIIGGIIILFIRVELAIKRQFECPKN